MSTRLKLILGLGLSLAVGLFIVIGNYVRLSKYGDRGFMRVQCVKDQPREAELRRCTQRAFAVWVEPDAIDYAQRVDYLGNHLAPGKFKPARAKNPLVEVDDPAIIVVRTNSDGKSYDELEKPGHLFWDENCCIRRMILRVPGLAPPEYLDTIIEHELGHSFGLDHDEDEKSVMHETIIPWGSNIVLPGDLDRIAAPYVAPGAAR